MNKKRFILLIFLIISLIIVSFFIYDFFKPKIYTIGKIEGYASDFMIDSNMNIYICGDFAKFNKTKIDNNNKNIIKIDLRGKIDKSFDQQKIVGDKINLSIQKIFLLDSGQFIVIYNYVENSISKTVVAKYDDKYNKVAELTSNSFIVNAIAVQDDGKILLGGKIYDIGDYYPFHLIRLNEDLSIDRSFDTSSGFNKQVYDIIYKDSKIYVAGEFTSYKGVDVGRIVRLNLDGSIDNSFALSKGANSDIFDIDIDEKENIYVAGMFKYFNDTQRVSIARINKDGKLDEKFNPIKSIKSYLEESGDASFTNTYDFLPFINKIVYNNKKLIIAGNFGKINDLEKYKLARIGKNLKVDRSFNLSIIDILKKVYLYDSQKLKEIVKNAYISKIVALNKNTYIISIVFPSNSLLIKIKIR